MKRILSIFLVLAMLTATVSVFAADDSAVSGAAVVVSEELAQSGQDVTVSVKATTDISSAFGSLVIGYDPSKLTPKECTFDSEFADLSALSNLSYTDNSIKASFLGAYNIAVSDVILSVTFTVDEAVENDTHIPVTLSEISFWNENGEEIALTTQNGEVYVLNYTLGDVNDDGRITILDAFLILRHGVGLINLSNSQLMAADVNKDGSVNIFDAVIIQRVDIGLEELDGAVR